MANPLISARLLGWDINITGHAVRPAKDFLPHQKNIHIHPRAQQEATEASLDTLGWVKSVTVNQRTSEAWGPQDRGVETLLDGHERIILALRRGDETPVPVEYVDLDPAGEDLFLAIIDELVGMAMVDKEKLDALLRDVQPESAALQEMLSDLAAREGLYIGNGAGPLDETPEPQMDRAAELQKQWGTALGQLWEIPSLTVPGKSHRLLCGDSRQVEDVTCLLDGIQANMAWCDPPFGIDLNPQRGKTSPIIGDERSAAQNCWRAFLPNLSEALAIPAHIFLCQDWTEFEWTLPLIREWFFLKSKIVWNKQVWGIGYYTRPKHEDILYCWKGHPPLIPIPVADVWDVSRELSPLHTAEKPPLLSAIAIEHFSVRADIVLDLFAGVGGSMLACEQLGRISYACDIEPKYIAVTLQRLADMGLSPHLVKS